jgi:AraC family transcriptional regulator
MRSPALAGAHRAGAEPDRVASVGIAGIGRVCFWQGGSLWIGRSSGRAAPHSHHAIQITLAIDEEGGSFFLGAPGDPAVARSAAIVMPHRRHQFDGRGGSIAQIFVEPETALGHRLRLRFPGDEVQALPMPAISDRASALGAAFRGHAGDEALVREARRLVDALAGEASDRAPVSSRVEAVIGRLSESGATGMSLAEAAAIAHLSPSRFRHLFVEETGITFRAYALWVRIQRAITAMMAGQSWTDAAHAAGFADSAHLSRTFRRMFGISPSMLIRDRRPTR